MVDHLPTIAEIAIVITGFAGLIVALRPADVSGSDLNAIRLRMLAAQTILLMFLCFLPSYLGDILAAPEPDVWQWANGLMGVSYTMLASWRVVSQLRSGTPIPPMLFISLLLYAVLVLFCALNAFGYLQHIGAVIYLTGIVLGLFTSCLNFLLLLFPPVRD